MLFSIFIWWLGRSATDAGLYITKDHASKLTLPPVWVFILCGLPTNKNTPRGVMDSNGLGMQLSCVLAILCNLVLKSAEVNSDLFDVICFISCLAVGLFFSTIARRVWPYPPAADNGESNS